jgi:hypothetical protein
MVKVYDEITRLGESDEKQETAIPFPHLRSMSNCVQLDGIWQGRGYEVYRGSTWADLGQHYDMVSIQADDE